MSFLSRSISCWRSPYVDRIASVTEHVVYEAERPTIEGLRVELVADWWLIISTISPLKTIE